MGFKLKRVIGGGLKLSNWGNREPRNNNLFSGSDHLTILRGLTWCGGSGERRRMVVFTHAASFLFLLFARIDGLYGHLN